MHGGPWQSKDCPEHDESRSGVHHGASFFTRCPVCFSLVLLPPCCYSGDNTQRESREGSIGGKPSTHSSVCNTGLSFYSIPEKSDMLNCGNPLAKEKGRQRKEQL